MPTALASAPTRAHTSFTLAWGSMVLIPVSVYTGTEATRVSRKEFMREGDTLIEVGRSPIRKDTGDTIDSADVGRYAEAFNGEWVLLTDDEIAECTSPRGIGEIVTFIPIKDTSEYLAEGQAQVRPKREKGKVNAAADRAFALLTTTMKSTKTVALVKIALRGPARYALLDHTGTFTLIYTADAVREPVEPCGEYMFSKQELALAKSLVEAVGIDTPVLTDDTAPVVQEFVNAKSSGGDAPTLPAPVATGTDLMSALTASIDANKAKKAAKGKVA